MTSPLDEPKAVLLTGAELDCLIVSLELREQNVKVMAMAPVGQLLAATIADSLAELESLRAKLTVQLDFRYAEQDAARGIKPEPVKCPECWNSWGVTCAPCPAAPHGMIGHYCMHGNRRERAPETYAERLIVAASVEGSRRLAAEWKRNGGGPPNEP